MATLPMIDPYGRRLGCFSILAGVVAPLAKQHGLGYLVAVVVLAGVRAAAD